MAVEDVDVCCIICLIKSSWFLETIPHSMHGNSESKYFLWVNVVNCWVGCMALDVICETLLCGMVTCWYCWSDDDDDVVENGNRIWCEWNKCCLNESVVLKISWHDEQEYWRIVVTVCGADDVVTVWTVDNGNAWSKLQKSLTN